MLTAVRQMYEVQRRRANMPLSDWETCWVNIPSEELAQTMIDTQPPDRRRYTYRVVPQEKQYAVA
jgi:hypothetical protein